MTAIAAITEKVCQRLNLSNVSTDGLTVKEQKGFTLVNYAVDQKNYGEPVNSDFAPVRGWTFDKEGVLIWKGFEYTPAAKYDNSLLIGDSYGFLPDGPVVMVGKYGGEVYFKTFRSMNEDAMRFGNTTPFVAALLQELGLSREELGSALFDDKPFSRTLHFFAVMRRDTMQIFRFPLAESSTGCAYYIGAFQQDVPEWEGRDDVSVSSDYLEPMLLEDSTLLMTPSFWSGCLPPIRYSPALAEELLKVHSISVLEFRTGQPAIKLMSALDFHAQEVLKYLTQNNLEYLVAMTETQTFEEEVFEALGLPTNLYQDAMSQLLLRAITPNRRDQLVQAIQSVERKKKAFVANILREHQAGTLAAFVARRFAAPEGKSLAPQMLKKQERVNKALAEIVKASQEYSRRTKVGSLKALADNLDRIHGQWLFDFIQKLS